MAGQLARRPRRTILNPDWRAVAVPAPADPATARIAPIGPRGRDVAADADVPLAADAAASWADRGLEPGVRDVAEARQWAAVEARAFRLAPEQAKRRSVYLKAEGPRECVGALAQSMAGAHPLEAGDRLAVIARLEAFAAAERVRTVWQIAAGLGILVGREHTDRALVAEVSGILRVDPRAARRLVDLAYELDRRRVVWQGLAIGAFSEAHARVICREIEGLSDDAASLVEPALVVLASRLTPPQLRDAARELVIAVDPDEAEASLKRAVDRRSVVMIPARDGMALLQAHLPAEVARQAYLVVDAMATAAGPDDPRNASQRRADALAALFGAIAAAGETPLGPLPSNRRRPPHLLVVMDAETLAGRADYPAHLDGYGPIPASVARAIADEATTQAAEVDDRGALVHLDTVIHRPDADSADRALARGRKALAEAAPQPQGAPTDEIPGLINVIAGRAAGSDPPWCRRADGAGRSPAVGVGGGRAAERGSPRGEGGPCDRGPVVSDCATNPAEMRGPPANANGPPPRYEPVVDRLLTEGSEPFGRESCEPSDDGPYGPERHPPAPKWWLRRWDQPWDDADLTARAVEYTKHLDKAGWLTEQLPPAPGPTQPYRVAKLATSLALSRSRRQGSPAPTDAYRPGIDLARHVLAKHFGCVFPTCTATNERVELDHIIPFTAARPASEQTTAANLAPLCKSHHQLKTLGLANYRLDADTGESAWRTATGRELRRSGPRLRPRLAPM